MENMRERDAGRRGRGPTKNRMLRHVLRSVVIFGLSVAICAVLLSRVYGYAMRNYYEPVDPSNARPVTLTIPSGSGASKIAKLLYEAGGVDEDGGLVEKGLINSKAAFKIYVDFTGKSNKLRAGTYVFSRNMSIAQIADIICTGSPAKDTVRFTITEGTDIEGVAERLKSLGILVDTKEFLELCKSGAGYMDYSFIAAIGQTPGQERDYLLEGYLFPDTYEIYTDASEKTIVNKMLMQFQTVFTDEYIARAQELEMSLDDVVKLAALIEKEARVKDDFARVSAVFHNRLAKDMPLESDASLRYIFKLNTLEFSSTQRGSESLYNTLVHKGLGLGPITNPGRLAIEAALYPAEEYMTEGYLFFILKNGETGELAYSKTNEEHEANKEQYKPNW